MKSLQNTFLRWEQKSQKSLGYLWQIYGCLAKVVEAVLPLGFADFKCIKLSKSGDFIIFPKLEPDFAMGAPEDRTLYNQYLVKLKEGIINVRKVGVIHVDLYPSNILWRLENDLLVIRINDWDAATLKNDSFTETVQKR